MITERPTHWLTFQQLLEGPIPKSLINEIDFEVNHEVAKLTATEKAQRRWFGRKHEKDPHES
jgi:hypothetical protein